MKLLPNKYTTITFTILWAAVICALSTSYFTATNTASFLSYTGFSGDLLHNINHLIRKSAHFTEYAILGFWCSLAIYRHSPKTYIAKGAILATIICSLYALSDETHQIFVPGRTPAAKDVVIDSAGAAFAIYLIYKTRLFIKLDQLAKNKAT
jgi:VanZ family protein